MLKDSRFESYTTWVMSMNDFYLFDKEKIMI